jgi:peroxiredoxin
MKRHRLIVVALAVSVAVNVALSHRVWTFYRMIRRPSRALLQAGTLVPSFKAVSLAGQWQIINYREDSRPTVLYVFTPPCSWCARNVDNFKALLEKERGEYRFIGLSLSGESLSEYIAKNALKFPVYSGLSSETLKTYKLDSTPQTIVISPDGRVLQDWVGAYVGEQKSQVEAFFHVKLPGLKELPEASAARN